MFKPVIFAASLIPFSLNAHEISKTENYCEHFEVLMWDLEEEHHMKEVGPLVYKDDKGQVWILKNRFENDPEGGEEVCLFYQGKSK